MFRRLPARLFIAASLWALSAALAQKANPAPVLPGGNSKEPINIDAAKLDYFDKEQKLVYTGNVVATQGESKLKATTLVIFLTPKEASDARRSAFLFEPVAAHGGQRDRSRSSRRIRSARATAASMKNPKTRSI